MNYQYGIRFTIDPSVIQHSDGRALDYAKDKAAHKLGDSIAQEKGWIEETDWMVVTYSMNLYVFTPEEMKAYIQEQRRKWEIEAYDTMTATTQRMIVECIKDVQQYMDMGWSVSAALRMVKAETTLTGAAWEAVVKGAN